MEANLLGQVFCLLWRKEDEQSSALNLGIPGVGPVVGHVQSTDTSWCTQGNLVEARKVVNEVQTEHCCESSFSVSVDGPQNKYIS